MKRKLLRKYDYLPKGSPAMDKATEAVLAVLAKWPSIWRQRTQRGTIRKSQPAAPNSAMWTVFCEQMARAAIRAAVNEVLK